MYNVLISSRNIKFIKKILPSLSNNIEKVKITNITTTEIETISEIISGAIDIIVFDNSENKLNIINILRELKNSFIFPFPTLIVFDSDINKLKKFKESDQISLFFQKDIETDILIDSMKAIIFAKEEKQSKEIYENKAFDELSSIGFNPAHNGTKYLVYASIIVKLNRNEDLTNNLEKYVYSIIANKYHTNSCNIKSNIQKAIKCAYEIVDKETLSNYFSIKDSSIATPKLAISIIARRI